MQNTYFVRKLEGHKGRIWCITLWQDSLWSGSEDGTIKQWNSNRNVCTFSGHSAGVLCLLSWGDFLCSGSADNTIRMWNAAGKCVRILTGHTNWVLGLTIWRGSLVSWSYDNKIRMWSGDGNCNYVWNTKYSTAVVIWNDVMCSGDSSGDMKL